MGYLIIYGVGNIGENWGVSSFIWLFSFFIKLGKKRSLYKRGTPSLEFFEDFFAGC